MVTALRQDILRKPESEVLFCGIPFKGLRKEDLLRLEEGIKFVITLNAEIIDIAHAEPRLLSIVRRHCCTFDGQVPYWLARLMHRRRSFEKLSGSDLIADIFRLAAERGYRVFLLGAEECVNEACQRRARELYGTQVAGYAPGRVRPDGVLEEGDESALERIRAFAPHFLLVAFGAPKQEFWIANHLDMLEQCGVKWVAGIGGALDLFSGKEKRAPRWIQNMGMESLWRFLLNPKRFKRYLRNFTIIKNFLRFELWPRVQVLWNRGV